MNLATNTTEVTYRIPAREVRPGDEVMHGDERYLVTRVAHSSDETMLELWARGAIEHLTVFLDFTSTVWRIHGLRASA